MPLYEYQCEQCGELFEVRQKFSDEPLTVHEKCNGKVQRLISVPALQFKGSGFYITDYAKNSGTGPNNGEKASDSSSSSSGGTGTSSTGDSKGSNTAATESKPAASSSNTETKANK